MSLKFYQYRFYKYLFLKILRSSNSDNITAFSVALGVFLGFFFPAGTQLIILSVILFLFKFCQIKINTFLSSITTLVSNPLTDIPLYSTYIIIGKTLYQTEDNIDLFSLLSNFWEHLSSLVYYFFSLKDLSQEAYLHTSQELASYSILFIKYFFTASIIFATIGSLSAFALTKFIIKKFRVKKTRS